EFRRVLFRSAKTLTARMKMKKAIRRGLSQPKRPSFITRRRNRLRRRSSKSQKRPAASAATNNGRMAATPHVGQFLAAWIGSCPYPARITTYRRMRPAKRAHVSAPSRRTRRLERVVPVTQWERPPPELGAAALLIPPPKERRL